jgi:hypothetical protein
VSVIRQMSLLGAEAVAPVPADLAGLLAAGGQITRSTQGAQVSVVVDHPWRASVLVAECARRGLAATSVATVSEHIGVRTAHSPLLVPLADSWSEGAVQRVPRDFALDGQVLRLWVEAAGRYETGGGYVLPVGGLELASRAVLGAALAAVGLPAQLVAIRSGPGPSYRIVGKRRLARLVEMVGDPPKQAPADIWPS